MTAIPIYRNAHPMRSASHLAATDTLGKPFIRQHMAGHRGYIDPVPFTRGKVRHDT